MWFHDAREASLKMKNAKPQPPDEEPVYNAVNPFSQCYVMSAKTPNGKEVHMFLFDKLLPEFEPPALCPYRLEYVMMKK